VAEEYISFEDALRRLELQDAQLKRLISENEIKAYRDGERMKLKQEDVERLRSRLVGTEGEAEATEELVFEDDEATEEPGMETVPLAEAETMVEKTVPKRPTTPTRPGAAPAAPAKAVAAPAKKAAAPVARRAKPKQMPADDAGNEGGLMKVAMVLAFLVLVASLPFAFDNVKGKPGAISQAVVKPQAK
jgi:excisionase family DNA binding protein